MPILLLILLAVVVAAAIGALIWYRPRPTPFARVLAEELRTQVQMDGLTRATAQAMRDAVRRQ